MQPCNALFQIKNQLECLSENDAVECTIRKHTGFSQITDEGGVRILSIDVEHVLLGDVGSTVVSTITVISDFRSTRPRISAALRARKLSM